MESFSLSRSLNSIKLGIFSRILIIITSIFYASKFINNNFNLIYANIPIFSMFKFEIYRMLTGIFISDNIFEFSLNIICIATVINHYEIKEGTVKSFIKFILNAVLFQFFIMVILLLLYYIFPYVLSVTITPLPILSAAFTTRHILTAENKYISGYPNWKVNDRFFVLFIIVASQLDVQVLFALYLGFLTCKFPGIFHFNLSEEDILHFEKNENHKFFFNFDSWIPIEECYFKSTSFTQDIENPPHVQSNGREIDFFEKTEEQLDSGDVIDLSDNTDPSLIVKHRSPTEDIEVEIN